MKENRKSLVSTIARGSSIVAAITIIAGMVMKFLHYNGYRPLLIIGVCAAVVWFAGTLLIKK